MSLTQSFCSLALRCTERRVTEYNATGSELDIRKAMRHFCRYPISDKQVIKTDDHRLSRRAAEVIANNFRSVNLSMAVDMIHQCGETL